MTAKTDAEAERQQPLDRDCLRRDLKQLPAFCPGFNLRRAEKTVSRWFDEAFRGASITYGQFAVLLNLVIESPLSSGDLARRLNSELSTISRNMDSIQRAGLVAPVAASDKRRRVYRLTDAGWEALGRNLPRWKLAQKRTMGRVGRVRWMVALGILRRLYED